MNANERSFVLHPTAGRQWRLLLVAAVAAGALLAAGCQSTPPVASPTPANAQTITAGTDLAWTSKSRSCQAARSEAKKAAKRVCELASYSAILDSCECERGARNSGVWYCTTQAVFTCTDGEGVGLAATN